LLPTEMRRLKQLEDENAKLKRIVADPLLDKEMLRDVIRGKSEACYASASIDKISGEWGVSIRRACRCQNQRNLSDPGTLRPAARLCAAAA
jgi:hypothetical protein